MRLLKLYIRSHIISREEVGFVPYGGYLKKEEEAIREKARIRLEDWQKSISDNNIDSRVIIKVGRKVHEILHLAESEKADLIVVGKKKGAGLDNPLAGSDTIEIVNRIKVPALVSKYIVEYKLDKEKVVKVNDHIFENPMLITNWSEKCRCALDLLISMSGAVNRAVVFHVIDDATIKKSDKAQIHNIETECKKRLNEYCEKLKSAGIEAEAHLGAGDVIDEVLRISRERHASMLITGTTCKDKIHEIFQGSISHEITKLSELPTLLVP
jgi:nucleotide-binding universal stress UspA family protein